MPDIADGEIVHVQGSAKAPYQLKNVGGVYSCSCPAWRNQGGAIDKRTCKHLKAYRGEQLELDRVGDATASSAASSAPAKPKAIGDDHEEAGSGTAPPVLLARKWENDIELLGWWISEKLDGVRAWWDGTRFVSRLGNVFAAPAWFTAGLPSHPLDGELWVGRKEFSKCISIVRSGGASEAWREVRYLVFDAPARDEPFEQRVAYLHGLLGAAQQEFARPVEHLPCQGFDHLKAELARVEALGGEGLMLRQPGSKYVEGRSTTLLKVKTFHDAEARVVDHEPGKGKHKGRLGALVCAMHDGTRFNLGTGLSDQERQSPPPIGTLITYRYQELTKDGVPRFPSFVGLAVDKPGPTAPSSTPVPMPVATGAALTPSAPSAPMAPAPAAALPSSLGASDPRAAVQALSSAWRAKRWSDVERALHPQCAFVLQDGTRVEGRAACLQSYRELMEQHRVLRVSERDHRLDVFGATAVACCAWEMTLVDNGRPARAKGTETLALTHESGAWTVVWRRVDEARAALDEDAEESGEGEIVDDSGEGEA